MSGLFSQLLKMELHDPAVPSPERANMIEFCDMPCGSRRETVGGYSFPVIVPTQMLETVRKTLGDTAFVQKRFAAFANVDTAKFSRPILSVVKQMMIQSPDALSDERKDRKVQGASDPPHPLITPQVATGR